MNDLKLYFAVFAVREDKQWRACKSYIAAKSTVNALNNIANKFGEVKMKSLEEVKLEEGMLL